MCIKMFFFSTKVLSMCVCITYVYILEKKWYTENNRIKIDMILLRSFHLHFIHIR